MTFTQLIGSHVFNIPLPAKAEAWCRECGGPIEARHAVRKKYSDSWVDEGLIAYSDSREVCPACVELSKGSTTRSLTIPGKGKVMIVSPSLIHPNVKSWVRACTGGRNVKKAEVYRETITLIEFLENILPDIELPFGIVYCEGGNDKKKHYLRYVPLNYSKNEIAIYVMHSFTYASIRPEKILTAYYDSLDLINLSPAKYREAFILKAAEHKLSPTEARILYRYLYTIKEDDVDEE